MTRPIWAGQYPISRSYVNFTFFSSLFPFFVSPVIRRCKQMKLLWDGMLVEPVGEEVGQVADFFSGFHGRGPNEKKRVNGNREVGKHYVADG